MICLLLQDVQRRRLWNLQEFQKAWAAYSSEKYWYFTNVHPKTAEFYVYVLDDTDFGYRVKQIDGPFSCH